MKNERAWLAALIVLVAIVGVFAGVVLTGLVIGVETDIGARVLRFGSPMLLSATTLSLLGSAWFSRARKNGGQPAPTSPTTPSGG